MFDVETILMQAHLLDLVTRAGGKPARVGGEYRCACPLHGGHNHSGFAIYRAENGKEKWKCFSGDCGTGDAIAFVQLWQHKDFKGACEFLDGKTAYDPEEMSRLSQIRMERANKEHEEAKLKVDAARAELQASEIFRTYHENLTDAKRQLWQARGVSDSWQDFWYLGYRDDYSFLTAEGEWHTPTLTIPLFDTGRNLLNIKHRLLNPAKPNDKYRPEKSGLGAMPPFLAIPEMGYDGDMIIVTEGEIKAMVLCTLDLPFVQYIGVPGRSNYKQVADKLKGKHAIFIPDPGAEADTLAAAKSCGGRILQFPSKVDDYVLANQLDGDWLRNVVKSARLAR